MFHLDRRRQPVRVAAAAFGCSIIASYVSANRGTLPVMQSSGADRGLIVLAGWLGVLLLAADGIDGAGRLEAMLRRIVIGATAMAALGVLDFCTGLTPSKFIFVPGLSVHAQVTDLASREGLVRVNGTAAHPLEFAAVLAMSLPLAIHQARFAPAGLRRRRWLQVALIAGTMPLTVSRSAIFGLIVVSLVLIPTWSRPDRRRAYAILLIAPLWYGWPAGHPQRIRAAVRPAGHRPEQYVPDRGIFGGRTLYRAPPVVRPGLPDVLSADLFLYR